ncbi:hypothetical protein Sjap_008597 [Stephania japonica]|uniref:Uncharacterized protein n=1 Tax=Stephania japonica TaxID=461633 RepID=A0AAP0JRF2_9MAGN
MLSLPSVANLMYYLSNNIVSKLFIELQIVHFPCQLPFCWAYIPLWLTLIYIELCSHQKYVQKL